MSRASPKVCRKSRHRHLISPPFFFLLLLFHLFERTLITLIPESLYRLCWPTISVNCFTGVGFFISVAIQFPPGSFRSLPLVMLYTCLFPPLTLTAFKRSPSPTPSPGLSYFAPPFSRLSTRFSLDRRLPLTFLSFFSVFSPPVNVSVLQLRSLSLPAQGPASYPAPPMIPFSS